MEQGEHPLHLLLGGIGRSGVIDYEIGGFDFFFVGDLCCYAARYFGTGSVFRNSKATSKTLNALFGMAGHNDQPVETASGARFEDEGSFDDGDGARIAAPDLFHPLVFVRDYSGVDNFVEFPDARGRAARRAERGFGQIGAVDSSVGIQDFAAEAANHFLIDRAAGLHERVRDSIRLDQVRAEFDKHLADSGFAACDAAGEAEFQQRVLAVDGKS